MQEQQNIQNYLKQEILQSEELIQKMRKKSTKDLNHKLRVSIRRIRTVIKLLQNDDHGSLQKNERQILKKIWKHLGAVRDFDVSEEIARKNELPLRSIKMQRKKADAKLQKDLTLNALKKLLNHLKKMTKDKSLKHVDAMPTIRSIRQDLKTLPLEAENLHAFRIMLKKVRYLMEALKIEDEQFQKYQDVLGKLNDMKVFLECQGESVKVRAAYKRQMKKALEILAPAKKLAQASLSKAAKLNARQRNLLIKA